MGDYSGPPIGALRWDGTTADPTIGWYNSAFGSGNPAALFAKFGHRRPTAWPEFQLWGSGTDTQAVVDAEIDQATGILDYFWFGRYPTAADLGADASRISEINNAFDAYMTSSKKSQIKFAFWLQTAWLSYPGTTWNHFVDQCNSIAAIVSDSQYLKIGGKPLIGLGFESTGMDATHWNTFKSIVGTPYLVIIDGSATAANTLGANAVCNYGPRLMPAGNGQHAWTEQAALNEASFIPSNGRDSFPNIIVLQDRRVFMGTSTPWVDQPTQPQLVNMLSTGFSKPGAKAISVHAWDEIAESGPGIAPTDQEGTRYLDAIKWLRQQYRPASYTYQVNAVSKVCTRSGFAGYTQPLPGGSDGIQGNYDADEITSSTTNDYVELTHERWATGKVYAVKGPDRGIAEILIGGVSQGNVDLYAASQSAHQEVFSASMAGDVSHTIRVRVTGTKNASSSSVKIGVDSFGITYAP